MNKNAEKACQHCGKNFMRRLDESPSRFTARKYCGLVCSGYGCGRGASKLAIKTCLHCEKQFFPRIFARDVECASVFKKRKFCSRICSSIHREQNKKMICDAGLSQEARL